MELHVLKFPESENTFLADGLHICVCACVISGTGDELVPNVSLSVDYVMR